MAFQTTNFPQLPPKPTAFPAPGFSPALPTAPGGLNRTAFPPIGGGLGAPGLIPPPPLGGGLPGLPAPSLPGLTPPLPQGPAPQLPAPPSADSFGPAAQAPGGAGAQPPQPGAAPGQEGAAGQEGFSDKNPGVANSGGLTSPVGLISTAAALGLGIWGGVRLYKGQGIFGYFKSAEEKIAKVAIDKLPDSVQTPLKEFQGKLTTQMNKAANDVKADVQAAHDEVKNLVTGIENKMTEEKVAFESKAQEAFDGVKNTHNEFFTKKLAKLEGGSQEFNKDALLNDIKNANAKYKTEVENKLKTEQGGQVVNNQVSSEALTAAKKQLEPELRKQITEELTPSITKKVKEELKNQRLAKKKLTLAKADLNSAKDDTEIFAHAFLNAKAEPRILRKAFAEVSERAETQAAMTEKLDEAKKALKQ